MLLSFGKTYLSCIGVIWLFVEMYNGLMPLSINCSVWCLISIALICSILWFLFDGYFIGGSLKQTIVVNSNAFDTKVIIKFSDLFKQEGWKTIPVNEFFDSIVDDKHVSSKSLHGILLKNYWNQNTEDWDQQINSSLSDKDLIEKVSRNSGKLNRYKIGATAIAKKDDNNFLCVALTKTDINTLQASAGPIELYQALTGLLIKAREVCSGSSLNIPLLGSGLSRTGIKANIIVDLILMAIFEESKKSKITEEIRIILPTNKRKDIDINTIHKNWS
ncbi:macro domain-containing protein [Methanosarcina sp. WWM596]|uniref:macro domain-containing protein n=1 Tax=Methanosarcina sp. WWM596 TaxID=1434103 RepID=UPI0006154F54|nr:macro domain-containing protein [Methanosarcina sp. WWM596]AKB19627.1 putative TRANSMEMBRANE PROTEIN [Methanosarcina sp. WWM596]